MYISKLIFTQKYFKKEKNVYIYIKKYININAVNLFFSITTKTNMTMVKLDLVILNFSSFRLVKDVRFSFPTVCPGSGDPFHEHEQN